MALDINGANLWLLFHSKLYCIIVHRCAEFDTNSEFLLQQNGKAAPQKMEVDESSSEESSSEEGMFKGNKAKKQLFLSQTLYSENVQEAASVK